MITYRIACIGDEAGVLSKAKEYFNEKVGDTNDFQVEVVDISKMSEVDIKSMHFHSLVYDISEVNGTEKDEALKILLQSKSRMSDIKMFPLAKSEVTRTEAKAESYRLAKLSGKDEINVIPINVSQEQDLKSVFQAIDVASVEYKSLVDEVLAGYQQEFEMTAQTLLISMEEKSPYTASHFRQVGIYAEAIARYMGKDEQDIAITKSIAILHDAGKLLMPAELLNNPHMTVGNERDQMALHAELGENVIAQDLFDIEERGGIVDHHNSRTDNKYAKIIAVADCIDTMTSQRAYNNPKTIQEVFRDLARNMHGRSFIGKDGQEVKLPPQFDKEVATAAIVMLANELGSIGYDIRAMLNITENKYNATENAEIMQILEEHKDEITINPNAKEGAYTSLGFRLAPTGHLEFKDRPAAVLNRETRVRSEYEFAIFKNSTDEQKKTAKTIMDLEANFFPQKLEKFRKNAELRVDDEDMRGRQTVQAGRVKASAEAEIQQENQIENDEPANVANFNEYRKNRVAQVLKAASLDNRYNQNGANQFLNEVSRARTNQIVREDKEEQRGA